MADTPVRKLVVYIAGPFRGPSTWDIEQNIRRAESLALAVWRAGAVALCPHTNTRFFQGAAPDAVWLDGDLELVRRCDVMLMTSDWARSTGACAEYSFARSRGMHVYFEHMQGVAAIARILQGDWPRLVARND